MKNLNSTKFNFRKTTVTVFNKSVVAQGQAKATEVEYPTQSSGCNSTSSIWTWVESLIETF